MGKAFAIYIVTGIIFLLIGIFVAIKHYTKK